MSMTDILVFNEKKKEKKPENIYLEKTPLMWLGNGILLSVTEKNLPELEDVLEVVPEDCDCSMAGLVDTLLLVFVPSSAVFLKKLCCRA